MHQKGLFGGLNKIIDMKICLILSRPKNNYCLRSPDEVTGAVSHIILIS